MDLAGSAVNTIGALGTAVYNRQTQNSVNRLNVALAGQQNAWNLAQWMRENSYNDPSAQVKRLREAGLNPALAMTQSGLVDAGNAMSGRPAAEARAVAPAPLDPLTLAQTRLINAETQKTKSETKETDSRTKAQDLANQAEEMIQNYPVQYGVGVSVNGSDTDFELKTKYVNLRVEGYKIANDLDKQGIQMNNATLNDLVYNYYLTCGTLFDDDGILNNWPLDKPEFQSWQDMTETEQFKDARALMHGDKSLQDLSIKMSQLSYEAAKAKHVGDQAYLEWVEANKENPMMILMLILTGLIQNSGVTQFMNALPSVRVNRSVSDHIHYHSYRKQ